MSETILSDQVNQLISQHRNALAENESLRRVNRDLKSRYDTLAAGWNDTVEDHRRAERDLQFRVDKAERDYKEIEELLNNAASCILQGLRAHIGDDTPSVMPAAITPHLTDERIPGVSLS